MAAAGGESHRSPTTEEQLLSKQAAASSPEDGGAGQRADTCRVDSTAGGGTVGVGRAGLEADVGNINELFEAQLKQKKPAKGKKLSKGVRGRGKTKSLGGPSASTSPGESAAATTVAAAGAALVSSGGGGGGEGGKVPEVHAAPRDAALADGVDGGGEDVSTAASAVGSATKGSTRERTQQMYETYRQTQEKLRTIRDESATAGCTFSPRLASKQKERKSEDGLTPDHLYQDFQKQLEKRDRLAKEEGEKISFRPVLPTASSRLAAKTAVTTPEASRKRAEDKSKATAKAMYKEFTFSPNTVPTKALTEKILAAKGKQAPVADRLYASSEAQAALLKSREEARAAKELAACTFRPDTSSSSKRSSTGSGRGGSEPTHERLFGLHGEMLTSKQMKAKELAARELMECTFSPALVAKNAKNASFLDGGNSKSKGNKPLTDNNAAVALAFASLPFADDESLAQAGAGGGGASANGRSGPVHERLYSLRGRGEVDREAFVDSECTFQPNMDRTSKSPASTRVRGRAEECNESRLEIMYNDGKLRQTSRSQSPRNYTETFRAQDEAKEMGLCTFQPNMSSTRNGRFKAESRGRALFDTLYAKREGRIEARERIRQEDMKAYTFAPELRSHKTRFGRSLSPQRQRPVYEELYADASTQRLAKTKSAEHLHSRECPFKPVLATRLRTNAGSGGGASAGYGGGGAPECEDRQQQPPTIPWDETMKARMKRVASVTAAVAAATLSPTAAAAAAAAAAAEEFGGFKTSEDVTDASPPPPLPPASSSSLSSSALRRHGGAQRKGNKARKEEEEEEEGEDTKPGSPPMVAAAAGKRVGGAEKNQTAAAAATAVVAVARNEGPAATTTKKVPAETSSSGGGGVPTVSQCAAPARVPPALVDGEGEGDQDREEEGKAEGEEEGADEGNEEYDY